MSAYAEGSNGAAEDCKIIRAKVSIQVRFRIPFADEQRRVLIVGVNVDVKRHATFR